MECLLVPLPSFQLAYCVVQFIEKDPALAEQVKIELFHLQILAVLVTGETL